MNFEIFFIQDETNKTNAPKLEDFDPDHPWVKDSRGRHKNLLAMLDWPAGADFEPENGDENLPGPVGPEDVCTKSGCGRAKAKNPRTGASHPFCSLKCRHSALGEMGGAAGGGGGGADESRAGHSKQQQHQYNVDFMIAMQLSQIQLMDDMYGVGGADGADSEELSAQFLSRAIAALANRQKCESEIKSEFDNQAANTAAKDALQFYLKRFAFFLFWAE